MSKQVVHFLERSSSSLVEEEVEHEGIGEAADGENEVVLPAYQSAWVKRCADPLTNVFESLRGDLTNGEVGEPRGGGSDTDGLGTDTGLHDLDGTIGSE